MTEATPAATPAAASALNTSADEKAKADKARQDALGKAYTVATQTLREAHRDEFNRLVTAEAKKLGYDWKPKLTAAEKAEQQVLELFKEHPKLAAKFSTPVPPVTS